MREDKVMKTLIAILCLCCTSSFAQFGAGSGGGNVRLSTLLQTSNDLYAAIQVGGGVTNAVSTVSSNGTARVTDGRSIDFTNGTHITPLVSSNANGAARAQMNITAVTGSGHVVLSNSPTIDTLTTTGFFHSTGTSNGFDGFAAFGGDIEMLQDVTVLGIFQSATTSYFTNLNVDDLYATNVNVKIGVTYDNGSSAFESQWIFGGTVWWREQVSNVRWELVNDSTGLSPLLITDDEAGRLGITLTPSSTGGLTNKSLFVNEGNLIVQSTGSSKVTLTGTNGQLHVFTVPDTHPAGQTNSFSVFNPSDGDHIVYHAASRTLTNTPASADSSTWSTNGHSLIVSNSVDPTELFAFTIPGNSGTNWSVIAKYRGRYFSQTANPTVGITNLIYFGGVLQSTDNTAPISGNNTLWRSWSADVVITANDSTTSQMIDVTIRVSPAIENLPRAGDLSSALTVDSRILMETTFDTTTNNVFSFRMANGTNGVCSLYSYPPSAAAIGLSF